jgi:hypothetical protein
VKLLIIWPTIWSSSIGRFDVKCSRNVTADVPARNASR